MEDCCSDSSAGNIDSSGIGHFLRHHNGGGQCFVCGNIGMRMCTTANERGIACVIAAALAFYTPGWALLVGIIVWAVVEDSELFCAGKATE